MQAELDRLPWQTLDQSAYLEYAEALPVAVQPKEEDVSVIHKQFYSAMEALWHKHQPSYTVYKDVKLVMQD